MPKIYVNIRAFYVDTDSDVSLVPNVGLLFKEDTPADALGRVVERVRANIQELADNAPAPLRELTAEEILSYVKDELDEDGAKVYRIAADDVPVVNGEKKYDA